MSFLERFGTEIVDLFVESSPYLLLGFFLAGLLKVFLPKRFVQSQLGGNDLSSILRAALYGLPLPLCSCSVLPTAASLRRAGASRGATTSFLISTPETGVDSISVTYALFDPVLAIVRPLAAFLSALFTGLLVAIGVRDKDEPAVPSEAETAHVHDHGPEHSHDHGPDGEAFDWDATSFEGKPILERLKLAVRYAFGPLLDDLTPWFVVGFVLSGLVAALVPDTLFTETLSSGWVTMALMIVVGTPIYICATASTPIAAALVAKGLDPGAALVFLLVGPATNVTTLLVVSRLLGKRTVLFYLGGIVTFALVAGLLTNALYLGLAIDLGAVVAEGLATPASNFSELAAIAFTCLLVLSAMRIRLWSWLLDGLGKLGAPLGLAPRSLGWRVVAGSVVVLWLAASSTTWVGVGEKGWLLRFGKVTAELDEPGLHVHLPWPITRALFVRPDEVATYEFGFRSVEELPAGATFTEQTAYDDRLETERLMLTGDEPPAALELSYVAQLKISNARKAQFGLKDAEAFARSTVEECMRRAVGRMTIDQVLYTDQSRVTSSAAEFVEHELERADAGLELVGISLADVHAPKSAHTAFRDIATAAEVAQQTLHEARATVAHNTSLAKRGASDFVTNARIAAEEELRAAEAERDALVRRQLADAQGSTLSRLALEYELSRDLFSRARLVLVTLPELEVHLYEPDDTSQARPSFFQNLPGAGPTTDPLRALGGDGEH